MAQYYRILDIDREEMLDPWDFGAGGRLTDFAWVDSRITVALDNLLKEGGRWYGDRVIVCGDLAYAAGRTQGKPRSCWEDAYVAAAESLGICGGDGLAGLPPTLYSSAADCFHPLRQKDIHITRRRSRYVINHASKEYVDNRHCPIDGVWMGSGKAKAGVRKVSPLILLLAAGNGLGSGDYIRGPHDWNFSSMGLVGSWTRDAGSIEVSIMKPAGYSEMVPVFSSAASPAPWTEEKNLVRAVTARVRGMQRDRPVQGLHD